MAAEDWFDEFGWDGYDDDEPSRCKWCGQQILWGHDRRPYQYSTGELHVCKRNPRVASAEEFPNG